MEIYLAWQVIFLNNEEGFKKKCMGVDVIILALDYVKISSGMTRSNGADTWWASSLPYEYRLPPLCF